MESHVLVCGNKKPDIVACILTEGENKYLSMKTGYEKLFQFVIGFGEQNCRSPERDTQFRRCQMSDGSFSENSS